MPQSSAISPFLNHAMAHFFKSSFQYIEHSITLSLCSTKFHFHITAETLILMTCFSSCFTFLFKWQVTSHMINPYGMGTRIYLGICRPRYQNIHFVPSNTCPITKLHTLHLHWFVNYFKHYKMTQM